MKVVMIKVFLLILFISDLFALDISKATNIQFREGKIYEAFSTTPFTGLGKFISKERDCNVHIFIVKNGTLDGTFETWSCAGQLLWKGTRKDKVESALCESWNKKGIKTSSLIKSKDGKIVTGFYKIFYEDSNELLSDLKYENGKKSGWEIDFDRKMKVFYQNDLLINQKPLK